MTLLFLKVRSSIYFMNLPTNVPYQGQVPRLHRCHWGVGYGNIPRCDVSEAVHGTSRAQRFPWTEGLGRLFANLTEWGQRFMATPRPLEMLGALMLVFTPNKKQFPLFKRHIFFFPV